MSRILLLEDDEALGRGICMALETPNCTVTHCSTRLQAIKILQGVVFDLLILDINLPDGSGLELLRTLRQNGTSTPAILLTANDLELDEVTGLEAGADDYITKPFDNTELILKIKSHLRLQTRNKVSKSTITIGEISINKESFEVYKNKEKIEVSTREFELLSYLMENAGIALSKEQIFENVWGNCYGDIGTVAVNIKNLREKIDPNNKYIITIWGYGYKFVRD